MTQEKGKPALESQLTELERLVSTLEKGDLSLEESLTTYEAGINLTRSVQAALAAAEQRVLLLQAEGGADEPGNQSSGEPE